MKDQLKLFIIILTTFLSSNSFSQTFNLKAGANLSTMLIKDDDGITSENIKSKPGFHLGGTLELPITEMFSVESGLLISTKGVKVEERGTQYINYKYGSVEYEQITKLNLLYLDIPITMKTYFDISDTKFYCAFGPYFGIGLIGNNIVEMEVFKSEFLDGATESKEEKIKWGSDKNNDDFKRLDYGLVIGTGVDIESFQIGLSYNLSLANISPYTGNGTSISHRGFEIYIRYKLPLKINPPK